MILELLQDDTVTKIKIEAKPITTQKLLKSEPANRIPAIIPPRIRKRHLGTRMTIEKVKEIRAKWEETVRNCGTKNAAAAAMAKIYDCSAKNIFAIVYKYSWANV